MTEQSLKLSDRYQAAIATHAHYDNLSVAIITGMVVLSGAAFAIKPPSSIPYGGALVLLVGAIVILVLLRLYENCASSALTAINLAAFLETNDQGYGIAHVSTNIKDKEFIRFAPKKGKGCGKGTRTVTILAIILSISLLTGAFFELSHSLSTSQTTADKPPNKALNTDTAKSAAPAS